MASTFSNLLYHVVFSTKQRQPSIDRNWQADLYDYLGGIVRGKNGTLLEVGGVADHLHLALKLRPDTGVADMVRVLKANSSKWVHETRKDDSFGWQTGYSAFTVSESQLKRVRAYVRGQEEHHAKTSFEDELMALLRKHGIEFDERYVLD